MSPLDLFAPAALARAQLARDQARCAWLPELLGHKIARMSASPFAFLRGAAPLFYDLCREQPGLFDSAQRSEAPSIDSAQRSEAPSIDRLAQRDQSPL